jgi:hypothetical protein
VRRGGGRDKRGRRRGGRPRPARRALRALCASPPRRGRPPHLPPRACRPCGALRGSYKREKRGRVKTDAVRGGACKTGRVRRVQGGAPRMSRGHASGAAREGRLAAGRKGRRRACATGSKGGHLRRRGPVEGQALCGGVMAPAVGRWRRRQTAAAAGRRGRPKAARRRRRALVWVVSLRLGALGGRGGPRARGRSGGPPCGGAMRTP